MRKTPISQVLGLVLILLSYLGIRFLFRADLGAVPFAIGVSVFISTAILGAVSFIHSIFD